MSPAGPPSPASAAALPLGELGVTLRRFGVVPVCGLLSPEEAGPLAAALVAGGLPLIEVTLRTPWSLASLEEMAQQPGILVGAGTVRTPAQMESAVRAGASFIVSPCLTGDLAAAAADLDVPFLPGVATPSEIQRACDLGMSTVKFFLPSRQGELPRCVPSPSHSMTSPSSRLGVSPWDSAPSYLAIPQVAAVGGGWMVPTPPRAGPRLGLGHPGHLRSRRPRQGPNMSIRVQAVGECMLEIARTEDGVALGYAGNTYNTAV